MAKFIEKLDWQLPGLEREMRSYCLLGTEIQSWSMRRVLEVDGGDAWVTL